MQASTSTNSIVQNIAQHLSGVVAGNGASKSRECPRASLVDSGKQGKLPNRMLPNIQHVVSSVAVDSSCYIGENNFKKNGAEVN